MVYFLIFHSEWSLQYFLQLIFSDARVLVYFTFISFLQFLLHTIFVTALYFAGPSSSSGNVSPSVFCTVFTDEQLTRAYC